MLAVTDKALLRTLWNITLAIFLFVQAVGAVVLLVLLDRASAKVSAELSILEILVYYGCFVLFSWLLFLLMRWIKRKVSKER